MKDTPAGILKGRDLEQFKKAEKIDAESTFNQELITKMAHDNEKIFVEYINSLGIKFQTQDDLVKLQTAVYGRPVLTPDILFIDEVYINDTRVYWIDFKDYAGTDIRFLYTSNMNQSVKYSEKWGTGAMCYRWSYVNNLDIPGCILLDTTCLKIKFKSVEK